MARERAANGSSISGNYPGTIITVPTFRTATSTGIVVSGESIAVAATGLMVLDYAPFNPYAVKIYTGANRTGTLLTVKVDTDTPGDDEVVIYPNGNLVFHDDEKSSTCYAYYTGIESFWGKTDAEIVYDEIRRIMLWGLVEIGRCNDSISSGDVCSRLPHNGTYFSWCQTGDPWRAGSLALEDGTEGELIGTLLMGGIYGLSENFGANAEVFVSTTGRLTTESLGNLTSPKFRVGRSLADGQCEVCFSHAMISGT